MLKISKKENPSGVEVTLDGRINEVIDFPAELGSLKPAATVNCEGVVAINSTGIINWIRFFTEQQKAGAQLRFSNLSPVLVRTCNLVLGFIDKNLIQSICLPYFCESCKEEFIKSVPMDQVKNSQDSLSSSQCPKCKTVSELDALPSEYFSFAD